MSDDIPDTVEASSENAVFVTQQTDLFNTFMSVPVTKLDADQYMVTDLDGVTESLFGSGNMNFAMMQAGQTDEAIQTSNLFDIVGGSDLSGSGINQTAGNISAAPSSSSMGFDNTGNYPAAGTSEINGAPDSAHGYSAMTSAGGLGVSAVGANANIQSSNNFSSVQDFGGGGGDTVTTTGVNGSNGSPGTSGSNGSNGGNGYNGVDGQDGTGGGTTIINIDITNNDLGDLTEIVNNVTNNVTDILTTITNNVFDTINNILDGTPLGPIGLNLDLALDNITNLNLDILQGSNIFNVINETIDLSQITTPISDILGGLTTGLGLGILLNPFQYDNSPGDTDLHVTTDLNLLGIPILPGLGLDIPLDPVEALLGDIDINLNVTNDILDLLGGLGGGIGNGDGDINLDLSGQLADLPLLGGVTDIVLNPVEDLLGDLDLGIAPSLDLFGSSETSNALGDTDIVIPLDINLLGGDLLSNAINIPLDPIESITGDIDLDLTAAVSLLNNMADNLLNDFAGGSGEDNLLSGGQDLLSDLLTPLLPQTDAGADTDVTIGLGGALLDNTVLGDATALVLNPVEDLIGDMDISLFPDIDLLGTANINNAAGDTDIVIPLDIQLAGHSLISETLNIPLDPIEAITGDIDLNATVALNLLGDMSANLLDGAMGGSATGNVLSDVGDQLSGLVGSLLPDMNSPVADTVFGGINDLLGNTNDVFEVTSNIPGASTGLLDSVLNPIGATIDTALDVLGNAPANPGGLNLDILNGDLDNLTTWTENTLPDAVGALGSGLGVDLSNLIPDPVNIASIIPNITNSAITDTLGQGLGNIRHFGGLFG